MLLTATATLRSPVAIALTRATGNVLDTLQYVPGTVLRGALAQAFLDTHGQEPDDRFQAMFVSGGVRYGNLRRIGFVPWPLSVRQCKARFDHHPKLDLLFAASAGLDPGGECACGAKLERPNYFCTPGRNGYETGKADTRRVAHAEIDPFTLRPRSGSFHSSEVLDADQTLVGAIDADPGPAALLKNFVGDQRILHVGRGKTRGQGRIELCLDPAGVPAPPAADRMLALNRVIMDRYPAMAGAVWLVCTFRAPAICYDQWLFSRSWLDPIEDLGLPGYHLENWFSRMTTISGWHAAARMPRADVEAISAGSVFLFANRTPGLSLESECDRIAKVLERLERRGIGERLDEGFGEAVFCDPLHTELAPSAPHREAP
jgi:CRISPR-associated protein Csx10